MNRRKFLRHQGAIKRFLLFMVLFCLSLNTIAPVGAFAKSKSLVTTPEALIKAIANAAPGEVILVGDIDFTPKTGISNKLMRISLSKNVTIKNGKKGSRAIFTNGSFLLQGSKNASERLDCSFEGISFDGGVDGVALSEQAWELPYSETEQEYTSDEPLQAQYAASFGGNADVSFSDCDFKNYMYMEGGAFRCYYGDYSFDPTLFAKLGDYSGCTLNLRLDHCDFFDNSAYFSGGAIYLDGLSQNVTLTAEDCRFTGNRSAVNEYSIGGGAIYASDAKVTLTRCTLQNNQANHRYSDELPDNDPTQGGAFYGIESELSFTDCAILENTASVGGGLALINTKAEIDGCIIAGNKAEFCTTNPYNMTGPWSNMGLGGALYFSSVNVAAVTMINTSIYRNTAKNAYGGIYPFYNNDYEAALPHGYGNVSLLFCSYAENSCQTTYEAAAEKMEWYERPGNVWEIPYVHASGCLVIDETLVSDFPKYDTPEKENDYNYFASPQNAKKDGIEKVKQTGKEYSQYQPETPENLSWSVPSEFAESVLNGRYNGEPKKYHVGSNYAAALYVPEEPFPYLVIIFAAVVAVLIAGVVLIQIKHYRGKPSDEGQEARIEAEFASEPEVNSEPKTDLVSNPVFLNQFTYEQIDAMLADIPEAQLLTGREREVIREILSGKQQLEIAHELGIEVTTVKDFNRKIYDKFGVANKKKLLEKVSGFLRRQ